MLLSASDIQAARSIGHVICRSALIFPGGYRLGVFQREGDRLRVPPLLDGFGRVEEAGGWNAGYATAFTHAWWRQEDWCCVDNTGQPLLWTRGSRLYSPDGEIGVEGLCVEVTADWSQRRVVAVAEQARTLIEEEDLSPLVDPSYDGDMLSADIAWLEALATSLAAALHCDVTTVVSSR